MRYAATMPDVAITAIQDWQNRPEGFLPSQFADKPRFQALARTIGKSAQEVENLYTELLWGQTLDLAVGAQLERWGALVGQQRSGLTDDEYRPFIQARIIANITHGQINDYLRIMELVVGALATWYVPHPPACFSVYGLVPQFVRDERRNAARRLIEDAAPGGVEWRAVEVPIGYLGLTGAALENAPSLFRVYGPAPLGTGLLARRI